MTCVSMPQGAIGPMVLGKNQPGPPIPIGHQTYLRCCTAEKNSIRATWNLAIDDWAIHSAKLQDRLDVS